MALYNRTNGRALKAQMRVASGKRTTISFYRYHRIDDPPTFRDQLYADLTAMGVLGRIYVALEGINAQISVPADSVDAFRSQLYSIPFLNGVRLNLAVEDDGRSFFKLKILVRKKIVADGLDDASFNPADTGVHVNAQQFNALADDPNTVIVDMRNHYESEVGYFKNAICPDVDTFREELRIVEALMDDQREKNLLMYCTGGIRCEKASAWMKFKGFSNVFQLDGGIIEYARQVKQSGIENKFIGKNFVFDERLGERISDDIVAVCHQCGKACDDHTNCRNDGCHLLFIQCADCASTYSGCCSTDCREIVALPEGAQKELRKGINKGRQVFRKGRSAHLRTNPDTDRLHDTSEHD
ncbi:MAG TPA: rhodanese-related sulfurtransferase [Chryseolinea sp.]|nr:rhodanese-related sulfurtransferase [Chryseolinea sp.]